MNKTKSNTSKKVRVAILGCGGMSGAHAQRFKNHPDAEIVALADISGEVAIRQYAASNLAGYSPEPAIFTDAAEMYRVAKPDAVTIVTPHTLHFEHGMQALKAGCHVFMEKPMVTSSTQAHELAEEVRKVGKILVVGYNTPCSPEFRYLRQLIRDGELGPLQTVTGWQNQGWKNLTTGTWRQNPKLSGGGQLYDSGAHMFNSLVWTVEQPIAEVHSFLDNCGTSVDINGTVNIRFGNGVLATMTITGNSNGDGSGMYFAFENGRVDIDGWGGGWIEVYKRGQGKVKYPPITGAAQSPNDNFIDAILGRAEPLTTPMNGVIQSELMDAIYESAKDGKTARPKKR